MSEKIRVAVTGANGRMGREVIKMVLEDDSLELVAAIVRSGTGTDAGEFAGKKPCGVIAIADLEQALVDSKPDVLVDFAVPSVVYANTVTAIRHGVRPIVGATGFTPHQIEELDGLCREADIGGLIAPNFSIGAILMMQFAAKAAEYLPHVEIIETHGDQKLDAPSGTAIKTAELIAQGREKIKQGNPDEEEILPGARGGEYDGFRIHSLRLPGVFAQQEVVFGGYGQSLKIRHDSYERAGYMPGVNIGIKKVMDYTGMVYGFEHLM